MSNNDLGLLALRLGIGGTLVAHGAQKLFGGGIETYTGAMHAMGFRPGKRNAVLAGASEVGGGALLALGLATPVGGAVAAAAMAAAVTVHKPNGFFTTSGGFEYPAVLGLTSVALAVGGPGRYSLDAATGHALNKPWVTVLALAAAGVGATLTIRQRQAAVAADAQESADAPADGPETPVAS
ncbi:DoxX family membrane protein [Kineococcus sp. T13]|uniref:DoxX family membrane protein n=1 Tax=Kineococcus vitellinus TaxID=2696565 RepID=UPI0014133EF1|nr:DoxX family membrane protein [Kineococcus vitellinus]